MLSLVSFLSVRWYCLEWTIQWKGDFDMFTVNLLFVSVWKALLNCFYEKIFFPGNSSSFRNAVSELKLEIILLYNVPILLGGHSLLSIESYSDDISFMTNPRSFISFCVSERKMLNVCWCCLLIIASFLGSKDLTLQFLFLLQSYLW